MTMRRLAQALLWSMAIRKLPIANASLDIRKCSLYGIRTGGIMDRFSNAAVEVGVERFFRVVASPEAKRDTGPETSFGEVGLIDNEQWAYGK